MSNMRTLLNSLVQIIFDYHDQQLPIAQEQATSMEDEGFFFVQSLEITEKLLRQMQVLVDQTKEKRRPLFRYLLSIIISLHRFIDSDTPINNTESSNNLLQTQLIDFIGNVYLLLQTPQSSSVLIHYQDQPVLIYGLQLNFIKPYCRTGDCFNRALAPLFFTSEVVNKRSIESIINDLNLFQYEILKKENSVLQANISILTAQQSEIKSKLFKIRAELSDSEDVANRNIAVVSNSGYAFFTQYDAITSVAKVNADHMRPIDVLMHQQRLLRDELSQLNQEIVYLLSELESIPKQHALKISAETKDTARKSRQNSLSGTEPEFAQHTIRSALANAFSSVWMAISHLDDSPTDDSFGNFFPV